MPTIHNTNRKILKKNNLQALPWSIGDLSGVDRAASDNDNESSCNNSKQNRNNHNIDDTNTINNTSSRKRPCKSPVIPSNLKRISDEIIWIQEGKAQHPAYILQDSTQSNDILFMSSNMVWVEWVSNGKKDSIYKHQIVQDGLQARKRHRHDYFTEDSSDKATAATDAQNNKKKMARSNSPREDRRSSPAVVVTTESSSTSLSRDDSIVFKKKSPRCKGKSILEGLDEDSLVQHDCQLKKGDDKLSSNGISKKQILEWDEKWEEMFDYLLIYIEETRKEKTKDMIDEQKASWIWDGKVPTIYQTPSGKSLGRWINNQRVAKKKGTLKDDREARLASTGLLWEGQGNSSWEQMIQGLVIYAQEQASKTGKPWDGNVPTSQKIRVSSVETGVDEEKALGRWVNRQRTIYQSGKLSKERQQQLEGIGLQWVASTNTKKVLSPIAVRAMAAIQDDHSEVSSDDDSQSPLLTNTDREENQTTQSKESDISQPHHELMETVDKKLKEADNLAKMQNIWHQRKPSQVVTTANSKPEEAPQPQFIRQQKDHSKKSSSDDHLQALRTAATAAGLDNQPAASQGFRAKEPQQFIQQRAVQQDWTVPKVNGSWRGDWDKEARRHIIASIMQILKQRRPNAPPEWHEKLPQMAKQLEGSLYYEASSFRTYNDTSTLNKRLESLAADIRTKTTQMQMKQNKNPRGMQHVSTINTQQQAARQHIYPKPSLNGGWQSDHDMEERRRMITNIMNHCRQRKPDASKEWLSKLPQLAHRLEESLYRSAPSFEAYNDVSTLKQRLEQLSKRIQQAAQQPGGQAAQPSTHQQSEEVHNPLKKKKKKKKLSSVAARAMAALDDEDDIIELSSDDDDDEPPSFKGQSHAERLQQQWDDMFQCLLNFIEEIREEVTRDMNDEEKAAWVWNGCVPGRYKKLGSWVTNQRVAKRNGKLKEDREARLLSTGLNLEMIPRGVFLSVPDTTNAKLKATAHPSNSANTNGKCNHPGGCLYPAIEGKGLCLNHYKPPQTEAAPHPPNSSNKQQWDDMFECLINFVEETRKEETQDMNDEEKAAWAWNGLVPAKYKTPSGKNLGPWVSSQRAAKKKGELKDDREARLVSTGLNLEMQGGKEHLQQLWEDMFQCLLNFIEESREEEARDMNDKEKAAWVWGGNVPTNYKTASGKLLGSWINTQRIAKRRGTLIEDREARLASTGLKWNVHTNNVTAQTGKNEEVRQQKWERMFQCLLQHIEEARKEETQHMNDEQKAAWVWFGEIPYNYITPSGINLGLWVRTQREAKKKGTMKDDREARLISTGLNLEMQGKEEKWDDMFQCLLHFIEDTRNEETKDMNVEEKAAWVWDGCVPTRYTTPSRKNLGSWVSAQRKAKRDRNLKEDREARLTNIGLRWSERNRVSTSDTKNAQPQATSTPHPPSSSNDILQRKMANARGKGLGLSLLVPLGGSVSRMKNSATESQPSHNGITQPGNNDCLFGREKWIDNHPGNKRYQQIIEENRLIYQVIPKNEKKTLRMKIVNDWRANNGGRFLKLNKTKMWEDIGDDKAQQYISLALREEDSTLMEAAATDSKQSSS